MKIQLALATLFLTAHAIPYQHICLDSENHLVEPGYCGSIPKFGGGECFQFSCSGVCSSYPQCQCELPNSGSNMTCASMTLTEVIIMKLYLSRVEYNITYHQMEERLINLIKSDLGNVPALPLPERVIMRLPWWNFKAFDKREQALIQNTLSKLLVHNAESCSARSAPPKRNSCQIDFCPPPYIPNCYIDAVQNEPHCGCEPDKSIPIA